MDNEKIILILCIIVLILAGVAVASSPMFSREGTNLEISDKKLDVGASMVVQLTDIQGNPLSNRTVHITLTDKDGIIINEDITTNSIGKAKFKMEEKGEYSVECKFDGDSDYAPSSLSDNLSVKKLKTSLISEDKTSNFDSVSGLSSDGYSYYPQYGPEVDTLGHTREMAIANDWHYIPNTIDGEDAGIYVPFDYENGCYHD